MSSVPRPDCKLVVLCFTDGGYALEVHPLRRVAGDTSFRKGYRVTPGGTRKAESYFCHELPGGVLECNCPHWRRDEPCGHIQTLVAVGLLDEPPDPNSGDQPYWDELVDIEMERGAP